jgi:4-hydroxy-tetrahydrodipicolinate synthase
MEEHRDVIRAAIEFTKHRVPVVAGTGSNCTQTAIQLSQEAEEAGADGLLIVTPYYNKATQVGLIRHYSKIADSVKTPIIMYNVPGRTGCNLLPETVAALFQSKENIVGLKEATGNMAQASKTMYLTDGKLDMYSGEDGLVVPLMSIGAVGVISVWSNIAPKKVHTMCDSFFKGDLATAARLQREALPLVDALFSEVNPIPVKTAMNLMGLSVGPLRSPMCEMGAENAAKLAQVMKDYGIALA